ncbi:MAG: DNA alkylation repair protein [Ruminococcaceae bacterium]|nr:DNA alkylation repair protein [Oscillospiraceae bacterium]
MTEIQKFLFDNRDLKYRSFSLKLIPNIDEKTVVGVRAPVLKEKAKQMYKSGEYVDFIKKLPHKYLEENTLHGYILCQIKDFDELINETERFLPFINNWAVCDIIRPKVFKKHTDVLYEKAEKWLESDETYTVRFGMGMLMSYFLDEEFSNEHLSLVAKADSEEYYISMMAAWYFATALAKQYSQAVKFIENKRLLPLTHNRAIQKAVESYRIPQERKEYLKTLKIIIK